jgi:hypothetical protein
LLPTREFSSALVENQESGVGERDPRKLASLADHRVKKSRAQIEAALTGDYRPELLFVLSQALQNYRQIQQQITQCDLGVEKQLAQIADCTNPSQASEPMAPSPDSAGGKLGSFYRRKRAQLGAPKAITATARKLGCLIYRLMGRAKAPVRKRSAAGKTSRDDLGVFREVRKSLERSAK